MAACPALLDRTMDTILERPQSLCAYAGSVLLIVNTVVLGFPSNDRPRRQTGPQL